MEAQDLTETHSTAGRVPVETGLALARWPRRAVAYIVDVFLQFLVPTVVLVVLVARDVTAGGAVGDVFGPFVLANGLTLVIILVYAPLLMAREGRHNGQTLGKQLLGIRVLREDRRPFELGTALVREVAIKHMLFGLGYFLLLIPNLLDALWPLWDERRQTLHDKLSSTVVVRG